MGFFEKIKNFFSPKKVNTENENAESVNEEKYIIKPINDDELEFKQDHEKINVNLNITKISNHQFDASTEEDENNNDNKCHRLIATDEFEKVLKHQSINNYVGAKLLLDFIDLVRVGIINESMDYDEIVNSFGDKDANYVKRNITFIRKKINFKDAEPFFKDIKDEEEITNEMLLRSIIKSFK